MNWLKPPTLPTIPFSRYPRIRPITLALLWFIVVLGEGRVRAQNASPPANSLTATRSSVAYLLVIDRSESMLLGPNGEDPDKGYKGPSRWELLLENARANVRSIRLHSKVWICSFNGYPVDPETEEPVTTVEARQDVFRVREFDLKTEADRKTILQYLGDDSPSGIGKPIGRTALYDAMGLALARAEQFAVANPGRPVTVYFYTDGEDTSSVDYKSLEEVEARFGKLIQSKHLNFYVFQLDQEYLPKRPWMLSGDKAKTQISLQLLQRSFVLDNPISHPRQQITLRFLSTDATWKEVSGIRGEVKFVSKDGIKGSVTPFELRDTEIPLTITIENAQELKPDRSYRATLILSFDESSKYELITESANRIDLLFRRGRQLAIFDLLPADGSTWVVGEPIGFSLVTSKDATVAWDFGNGQTATKREVIHTFETPGEKTVRVKVRGAEGDLPAEATIRLHIIELALHFELPEFPVFEGQSLDLLGRGSKAFQRFEWIINGQIFPSPETSLEKDQKVTRLPFVFRNPGEYTIQLVGRSELVQPDSQSKVARSIVSPIRRLTIHPKPRIEVDRDGVIPYRAQPVQFHLRVPRPDLCRVRWDFDAAEDLDETERIERRIVEGTWDPAFRYPLAGSFVVKAELMWNHGVRQVVQRTIQIVPEPVHLEADFRVQTSSDRVFPGTTVKLENRSTGDVLKYEWYHILPSGKSQRVDANSVVVRAIGEHLFKLTAIPLPVRNASVEAPEPVLLRLNVVRPPPWALFWCLVLATVAGAAIIMWLAIGNGPRDWRVRYSTHALGPNAPIRTLGRIREFRWNWWTKQGRIPVAALIDHPFWKEGDGRDATLLVQNTHLGPTLKYSRKKNALAHFDRETIDDRSRRYECRELDEHRELRGAFMVELIAVKKPSRRWLAVASFLITMTAAGTLIVWFYNMYIRY